MCMSTMAVSAVIVVCPLRLLITVITGTGTSFALCSALHTFASIATVE